MTVNLKKDGSSFYLITIGLGLWVCWPTEWLLTHQAPFFICLLCKSSISLPLLQDQNMAPSVKIVLNFTAPSTKSKSCTICQSCPKFHYFYWHNLSKLSPIWLFLLQSQNLAQIVKIVLNFTAPTTKSESCTICQNCFQFYSSHYKVQIWHNLPKLSSILP